MPVYFDVGDVPVHVYIALYTSSGGATPGPATLVAQTAQLTTVNGITEGLITPQKAIAAGSYFLVIKGDSPYHVQNEGASTTTSVWYNTSAISFAPFSGALSGLGTATVPVLDLYAVTVP